MEEVSVLIGRAKEGDKKAREVLIEENLGLVHHVVKRFLGRGYDGEDLFQIGTIGLMKAIDHFDMDRQVCFSTYAVPVITGEIKRFLRDDGMVKVSRSIKENGYKVKEARERLAHLLRREPTLEEVAAEVGISKEDVIMAMEAGCEVESIYCSVTGDDGSEMFLLDKVVMAKDGGVGTDYGSQNPLAGRDTEKEKLLDHILIGQLLESLEEQERQIIWLRYFGNKTQTQIADMLGLSQVQVSRMEKKILRALREKVG